MKLDPERLVILSERGLLFVQLRLEHLGWPAGSIGLIILSLNFCLSYFVRLGDVLLKLELKILTPHPDNFSRDLFIGISWQPICLRTFQELESGYRSYIKRKASPGMHFVNWHIWFVMQLCLSQIRYGDK